MSTTPTPRVGVYVASKSRYAGLWQDLRDEWKPLGFDIISTWIDEAGEGETADMADLWYRCIAEAQSADVLIAVHRDGDEWKGAFVEIGAALSFGIPVYVIGDPPGSWINHPHVRRADDVYAAAVAFEREFRPVALRDGST